MCYRHADVGWAAKGWAPFCMLCRKYGWPQTPKATTMRNLPLFVEQKIKNGQYAVGQNIITVLISYEL